jgi:hypothetical protein
MSKKKKNQHVKLTQTVKFYYYHQYSAANRQAVVSYGFFLKKTDFLFVGADFLFSW